MKHESTYKFVRRLTALAFLPAEHISAVFESIKVRYYQFVTMYLYMCIVGISDTLRFTCDFQADFSVRAYIVGISALHTHYVLGVIFSRLFRVREGFMLHIYSVE